MKTDSDKQRRRRRRKVCLCCCTRLCLHKCLVNKPFNEWKKSDCERHKENVFRHPHLWLYFSFIWLVSAFWHISHLFWFSGCMSIYVYMTGRSSPATYTYIYICIFSRAVYEGCIYSCFYLDQSSVIHELPYFHGWFLSRAENVLVCFKTVDFILLALLWWILKLRA